MEARQLSSQRARRKLRPVKRSPWSAGAGLVTRYAYSHRISEQSTRARCATNSPTFDEQLALNEYWKQIGGTVWFPETNRAADRFARASFYINAIPKGEDPVIALASVFSVIRNVSVPSGIGTPGEPNISSARWRTIADHKRMLYFFESALSPNTFWVDLKKVDFSASAPVERLDLGKDQRNTFNGEVSRDFQPAPPFRFLGLDVRM